MIQMSTKVRGIEWHRSLVRNMPMEAVLANGVLVFTLEFRKLTTRALLIKWYLLLLCFLFRGYCSGGVVWRSVPDRHQRNY